MTDWAEREAKKVVNLHRARDDYIDLKIIADALRDAEKKGLEAAIKAVEAEKLEEKEMLKGPHYRFYNYAINDVLDAINGIKERLDD